MGAVYVVRHTELPLEKVVKVLLPWFASHKEVRARFEREAKAASLLQHENILGIDDYGRLPNGELWYMMQLLQGQSLDELLRARGRLSEAHALPILLQLCRALEHAHRLGVVHRDLKPENVFLCETGVKLIDFGIAKIVGVPDGAKTAAGSTIGTPNYMPPEQNGEAHQADPRSDIYALGVLTCKMVTGRLPWGVHDARELYLLQCTQPPQLDGLSPRWKALVAASLEVLPEKRPQSARAFANQLATELEAQTLTFVPSSASCSGEIEIAPLAIGSGKWESQATVVVVPSPSVRLALVVFLLVAILSFVVVWAVTKHLR